MSGSTDATSPEPPTRLSDPQLMPQRVYLLRAIGMGMGVLPMAAVLVEIAAPWWSWAFLAFTGLLWPHLAFLLATRSRDPYRSELRNLLADSVLAGLCVPLMHYNLLPSVMLLTVVTADRINTGIRGLWLRSLPGMALSAAAGGLLTGYAFRPETSTTVLLACLPMLMAYTLSVSLYAHRLVRKVQAQNRKLAELSRLDSLTGLGNRGHWQAQAEQLLQARHALGVRATLLLADIDHFKAINDGWGHGLGDDVLNAVANEIKLCIRGEDSAGRIGGDEFAIAIRADLLHAESLAERLCRQVEALHFPQQPELRCSISLGLAEAGDGDRHLRDWLESADRALYRAKHGGRNRVGSAPAPSLGQPGSR